MRVAIWRVLKVLGVTGLLLLGLFVWNGLSSDWQDPVSGRIENPVRLVLEEDGGHAEFTMMAWNIAKCDFHEGGARFKTKREVRERLDEMAQVIKGHGVDLLFLSEVVLEAAPCQVNQVAYLAERAGFAFWCYGDNYSFGIPGVRIRSGNAILSKLPLEAELVVQLPGGAPFWNPTGNRRVLWGKVVIAGEAIRCASIRNDSFDLVNNADQVREILAGMGDGDAVIGGDLNATPGTVPLRLWEESAKFAGVFDGAATFPASAPDRRIDTVLVPAAWLEKFNATWTHEVLDVDLSDHEPVVVRAVLRRSD